MADVWTHLQIGGRVTRNEVYLLEQEIAFDLNIGYKKDIFKRAARCLELKVQTNFGDLEKTESYCREKGIAYTKHASEFDEFDATLTVFIPGVVDHVYTLNRQEDAVVEANALMYLYKAIREVTFKNAPMYINDKGDDTVREYAKHLLSGKPSMEFVLSRMKEIVPPPIPELPHLHLMNEIEIKYKLKKGKKLC